MLKNKSFFYFDPPYRPLSGTSNFNEYAKESFNDDSQIRLKEFCDQIAAEGYSFMLSNSDCKGKNENDTFFDDLYANYYIDRVYAYSSINSDAIKEVK